ncbi:hypothetical protein EVAR_93187_1 [Eumeta japonica]|uniref:Uncharacterized protein n=1 Tax=Eumeta variegata TaxID=151549 RepID=A0A4C1TXI8_EUMVA|nr:hypothetical protein EVAR_93187_1 [Eumeta japonica]
MRQHEIGGRLPVTNWSVSESKLDEVGLLLGSALVRNLSMMKDRYRVRVGIILRRPLNERRRFYEGSKILNVTRRVAAVREAAANEMTRRERKFAVLPEIEQATSPPTSRRAASCGEGVG